MSKEIIERPVWFKTSPNQQYVKVIKAMYNEENVYFQVNKKAFDLARENLECAAFSMWTYFAENQNGYGFFLSREIVCRKCRFSESTYKRAKKELEEKGYLEKQENGSLIFREFSIFDEENKGLLMGSF